MRCLHIDPKRGPCRRGLHQYGFHIYQPIARVGRRKQRTVQAERVFKANLVERADGFCEATQFLIDHYGFDVAREVCGTGVLHAGVDPHHLDPSDRARNVHEAARGLLLCRQAHNFCHDRYDRAKSFGLIRPSRDRAPASWGAE